MPGVLVNVILVIGGSLIGILFRRRLKSSIQNALVAALALCVFAIGATSAAATNDTLCMIVCAALGTALGEWINIDAGIEKCGKALEERLSRSKGPSGKFTEGFVSAGVLFCVGSMAIMGALDAGIRGDYTIFLAKSIIDFISAIAMGAALGIGVAFSALLIFVYQGALTLLSGWIGPALSAEVVQEMSSVGGITLMGIAINMLGLRREPIRAANMIPAIFLPIAYIPLSHWLGTLFH